MGVVVFSECIWKSGGCGIHRKMPMSMGNSNHQYYEYECLHNDKTEIIIDLKYNWYYDSITLL